MSTIGLATDLVLANTTTRPGTLVLPLSTQIPGRTITIKCATGSCGVSTCFISTSGGDIFEDGSIVQALTTPYGFMKVTASATQRKWFVGATTQPTSYTASTIRTSATQATSISTTTLTTSSLSLITDAITPFTPRSIPGCVLWLDGKDVNGTGTNITAGTTMTQWIDKSGGGNSTTSKAGTITMTANAIGSNAAPVFPNSPSYFLGSLPTFTGTAIYHFAVATLTSNATAYGRILGLARTGTNDFGDTTTEFAFIRNAGTQALIIGRNSSYLSTPIPAYSTPFLVQSSQNGSTESIGVNGTLTPVTQNTGISTGFNISAYGIGVNPATGDAGSYYDGVIAEVIVYMGTVLTTAQIQSVEGYLAQKWGLTSLLPATHPGRTTQYFKALNYVAPSTQSFSVSSSLAYWGPFLLNSGFRTAQPQVFFLKPAFTLISSGLVNRWIFNNGSGSIVTDTVGGQNISLSGTYTWSSSVPNTTIALKSLSFDGYTGVGSAAVNATLQTTTYSVSMWYYHTGISDPRGGNPIIIESGLNQNEAFAIATGGFTGTSQPYFYSSVYNGGFYRAFSSATPLNTWTHLAVTIGNSKYNAYQNGVLDSGNTNISITSGLPFTLNGSFIFGKGDNAYGDQFGGSIFDVRIYNRVLSAEEIAIIYAGTG